MKEKIFNSLKQEYKSLGLSDEILQGHASALAATGLVTDDNLTVVISAQKAGKDKPEWQKELDKRFEEFSKKDIEREKEFNALKEKYEALEKEKAESARTSTILSKAKELGIPDWRIKEGFAISADADEAAINSHLTTVATNLKTANLPSNRMGHVLDDGKPSKEQISNIADSLIH